MSPTHPGFRRLTRLSAKGLSKIPFSSKFRGHSVPRVCGHDTVGRREQGVHCCHHGGPSSEWQPTCRCSFDAHGVDAPRIGKDTLVYSGKTD